MQTYEFTSNPLLHYRKRTLLGSLKQLCGAKEIGKSVKGLLHKPEDLTSSPRVMQRN